MASTDRTRWLGLAVLSLGVSMIIVDATIVNVALPSIIREFGLTLSDAEWINSIYSLVFAALLITLGRVGDMFGRRRLFVVGIVVFVAASAMAGTSSSGSWLIAARFLQGVGAAAILPATLSTVNATFRGRERGIAFGIWGSVIGGMAAIGPLLGGWLTTSHSWRWAFYINVPIGVIVIVGSWLWVRETRDEEVVRKFDVPGIILSGLGLTGVVFALIEGPRFGFVTQTDQFTAGPFTWPDGWVSPVTVTFIAGALLLVGFVFNERSRAKAGKPVLFDLTLFQYRSFSLGNATVSILSLGEFGLIFVFPLFVQAVFGYSAFRTGLLLVALAIGAFVGGPTAGVIATRIGPRRVVSFGMALEAVAIIAVALLFAPDRAGWAFILPLFVYGIGVGLAERAAHERHPFGDPPEGIRAGIGHAIDLPPGRRRHRDRAPRHRARHESAHRHAGQPRTDPRPAANSNPGHRRRHRRLGRSGAAGDRRDAGIRTRRRSRVGGLRRCGDPYRPRRSGVRARRTGYVASTPRRPICGCRAGSRGDLATRVMASGPPSMRR